MESWTKVFKQKKYGPNIFFVPFPFHSFPFMDISVIRPLDGQVLTAYVEGSLLRKDEVQV